jgi:hypothetical protein
MNPEPTQPGAGPANRPMPQLVQIEHSQEGPWDLLTIHLPIPRIHLTPMAADHWRAAGHEVMLAVREMLNRPAGLPHPAGPPPVGTLPPASSPAAASSAMSVPVREPPSPG